MRDTSKSTDPAVSMRAHGLLVVIFAVLIGVGIDLEAAWLVVPCLVALGLCGLRFWDYRARWKSEAGTRSRRVISDGKAGFQRPGSGGGATPIQSIRDWRPGE